MAWWRRWPTSILYWTSEHLWAIRVRVFTRRSIGAWIILMLWLIDRVVNYWSNWEFALAKAAILQATISGFVVAHATEANLQCVLLGSGLAWLLLAVRYPKKSDEAGEEATQPAYTILLLLNDESQYGNLVVQNVERSGDLKLRLFRVLRG
jgi:hypothetical protein